MNQLIRIAIASPLRRYFDYLVPDNIDINAIAIGARVRVPFGYRQAIGIVIACDVKSEIDADKLKYIHEILDEKPLFPESILKLCSFASEYYHHSHGDVLMSALPKHLREGKNPPEVLPKQEKIAHVSDEQIIVLNNAQQNATDEIVNNLEKNHVYLLDGVTGSGKTEVYLRAIDAVVKSGKQALVLIPEIGLTPQTISRFESRFPHLNIAVFHSKLTDKNRLNSWWQAHQGVADIIIGTRSAIFTPMLNPGIIIIDEEHDLSFKQQSGLRYSARDLAVLRAKLENIPLILGSATPSLESIANANREKYRHLTLPERAGNAIHPTFNIIDIRKKKLKSGLSSNVIQNIKQHLEKDGQILIFVNRRGYAPSLLCHQCGWVANCAKCDIRLTMHDKPKSLCCHHCGSVNPVPKHCPTCNSEELVALGIGTERLEIGLMKLFPEIPIARIDSDTTRKKGAMQEIFESVTDGKYKILVGTQMLTKGHHFPNVTMVVILNADHGLFSADFRANEYLAQLITQVSGRAGRANKPGEVFIQTHHPEHELFANIINRGYSGFAKANLIEREDAELPPFAHLAMIRADSKTRQHAHELLIAIASYSKKINSSPNLQIMGPIQATIERKSARFHAQLLLQCDSRQTLHQILDSIIKYTEQLSISKRCRWSVDVDPVEAL